MATQRFRTISTMLVAVAMATAVAPTAAATTASTAPDPFGDGVEIAARSLSMAERLPLAEARKRIHRQAAGQAAAESIIDQLGAAGAGAWIDHRTGDLVINVADAREIGKATGRGVRANVVTYSYANLASTKDSLDNYARSNAVGDVTSWFVDVPNNQVVVVAPSEPSTPGTEAFLRYAGGLGPMVRFETGDGTPKDAAENLYGGLEIYSGGTRCSVGFNVEGPRDVYGNKPQYVLTAGHCASAAPGPYWYRNGAYLGFMSVYTTYNEDHGIISNPAPLYWVPQPSTWRYDGMISYVTGWSNTVVGSYVCKSGRTTGWTCGTVTAVNATTVTSTGPKYGMVRTNMCVEPGDSGGSVLVGNRAAGLVSSSVTWGASALCGQKVGRANVAFFQPVGVVLSRYGVTLRS